MAVKHNNYTWRCDTCGAETVDASDYDPPKTWRSYRVRFCNSGDKCWSKEENIAICGQCLTVPNRRTLIQRILGLKWEARSGDDR